MRILIFIGSSRQAIRDFPETARRDIGKQLLRVQAGLDPEDWKPMKTVGAGVREVRVRDESGAFRAFYVTNIGNAVYVLHAFRKKTEKTAQADIEVGKTRFKQISR